MAAKSPAAPAVSATGATVSFLVALTTGLALRIGVGKVARCQGTRRTGSTDGEIWLARSFVGFSPMGSHLATTLARRMVRRATLGAATTLLRARTWLIVWCVRCIASRFARRLMVAQPVSLLAPLSSQSPADQPGWENLETRRRRPGATAKIFHCVAARSPSTTGDGGEQRPRPRRRHPSTRR